MAKIYGDTTTTPIKITLTADGAVDLSDYYDKEETDALLEEKVNKSLYYYGDENVIPTESSLFEFDSFTGTITEYLGNETNVVVPYEIDGIKVLHIGEQLFWHKDIGDVIIPNTVTSIGSYAFAGCTFRNFIIPNSITYIDAYAFYECGFLMSIIIPDSVTSVDSHAFDGCRDLRSITIPNSVTEVGVNIFDDCGSLSEIIFKGSKSQWDSLGISKNNARITCEGNLASEVYVENVAKDTMSLYYYGDEHIKPSEEYFFDLTDTGELTVREEFQGEFLNESQIVIPYEINDIKVKSLGYEAFFGRFTLTSIIMPNGITSIDACAFEYCEGLPTIIIPEGVTSIGYNAFSGCINLTSIIIPDSVTYIGEDAFYNCVNLKTITFKGSKTQWDNLIKNKTLGCEDNEDLIIIFEGNLATEEYVETKADKATTLEGYGIEDAYTKAETDDLISKSGGSVDLSEYAKKEDVVLLQKGKGFKTGAIKPESTSFFDLEYAGNLFNTDTIEWGYYLNRGKPANNPSYFTTDFIKVKSGETLRRQYKFNGIRRDNATDTQSNVPTMYVAAYDSNNKSAEAIGSANKVTHWVIPEGAEYVRVSMDNRFPENDRYSEVTLILQDDATVIPFEEFGTVSSATLKSEYLPQETVQIRAYLPPVIYCAVGRTIEIYNNQMCPALTDELHVRWECEIGRAMQKKFSVEGKEKLVGEHDLTASIIDNDLNVLWTKTIKLKIVRDTFGTLSICAIGDSLTNSKPWQAELINLHSGISFVGTMAFDDKNIDSSGVEQIGFHEGRSGWTARMYNEAGYDKDEEDTSKFHYFNPFYNSTKDCFDWNYYVENSLGRKSPGAVILFLGTNGINIDPKTNGNSILRIVGRIREDDASIPIFVINTLYRSGQDGIGNQIDTEGYAKKAGQYKYEEDLKVFNLMEYVNEGLGAYINVYAVPVALCHDSEHNYGAKEAPVNPRSTIMEVYPIESVHPQNPGYYQIADIVYSTLCGCINQA